MKEVRVRFNFHYDVWFCEDDFETKEFITDDARVIQAARNYIDQEGISISELSADDISVDSLE